MVTQNEIFAFLENPTTHAGDKVQRIDTHAASVFLAGGRAFKVKHAVRFPFLDYSTLEKRRAACIAELEINRTFAPDLYLRALPITQGENGLLELGGKGKAVEWAVEMRRFDENQTLDHLADLGKIDDALADKLALSVVAMHATTPIVDAEPWLAALERFIDQNTTAFRGAEVLFPRDAVEKFHSASVAMLHRLRPLLVDRGRLGLVRRGHGDLHLGNIALLEGRPVPFDAIEFDPIIATGDLLYDIAFLLMDLVERGLGGPANIVLNRYLAETRRIEDLDGLATLPFFMSLRAAIRANVTAAKLANVEPSASRAVRDAAMAYFALATHLIAPVKPKLVAMGGLSGTGKSTLARALAPFIAPDPGAVIVRSDVERKALFGVPETQRLPQDAYRPHVTAQIYAALANRAAHIVAAGHSVIIDAVFAKPIERAAVAEIAKKQNVAFYGLYLVADLETRLKRVSQRGPDASDADKTVAGMQENISLGNINWLPVDTSGGLDETLDRTKTALFVPRNTRRP